MRKRTLLILTLSLVNEAIDLTIDPPRFDLRTLEISSNAQQMLQCDVMMHLTCTNMPQDKVKWALDNAKAAGIRNVLALRGGTCCACVCVRC